MASSLKNTSTTMSAVNSSNGIPPLPPPPAGSQKNAEKKPTPIFSKPLTSSAPYTPTTSDMFTLILQMKEHIQQQDKTNDRILLAGNMNLMPELLLLNRSALLLVHPHIEHLEPLMAEK